MAEDKDREWAKKTVAHMVASGERFWLAGVAHCLACNHQVLMISPYPIGLEPNGECESCGAMLVVFDDAASMKIAIAKRPPKGLDEKPR